MATWSAAQLDTMEKRELAPICRQLRIKVTKNTNAAELRARILSKQAVTSVPAGAPSSVSEALPQEATEAKPGFEKLITGEVSIDAEPASAGGWGGARPGSGPKVGGTQDLLASERAAAIEKPNPVVQDFLEMLFSAWAAAVKCPEVALTKEEAFDLALPWTQGLELMGVNQRLPPWLGVCVRLVWTTASVGKMKAKCARDAVAARKAAAEAKAA
jgi:hypothetical protein